MLQVKAKKCPYGHGLSCFGRQNRHFYFRFFLLSRKASNATIKLPKDISEATTLSWVLSLVGILTYKICHMQHQVTLLFAPIYYHISLIQTPFSEKCSLNVSQSAIQGPNHKRHEQL